MLRSRSVELLDLGLIAGEVETWHLQVVASFNQRPGQGLGNRRPLRNRSHNTSFSVDTAGEEFAAQHTWPTDCHELIGSSSVSSWRGQQRYPFLDWLRSALCISLIVCFGIRLNRRCRRSTRRGCAASGRNLGPSAFEVVVTVLSWRHQRPSSTRRIRTTRTRTRNKKQEQD